MDPRHQENGLSRRVFLAVGAAAAVGLVIRFHHSAMPVEAMGGGMGDTTLRTVKIVQFSDAGVRGATVTVPMVTKTEAEWKKILPAESFGILRHADTEYPFHNKYWNLHDKGIFRCAGCDTALFSSATKFESGTGWPSFWQPLAQENVNTASDSSLGMDRTEVKCRLCDGHLGHVFDDGPKPTGLRYCMNSAALKFVEFA